MADRKKLVHIHSNVANKIPNPSALTLGEIAVNYSTNNEFLSINNGGNIVRFSSDLQLVEWMEKKEVFPYLTSIEGVNLLTNSSKLVLKFNQAISKNSSKYNLIDNWSTSMPSISADTSMFVLTGSNPTFSSITANNGSTLKGPTLINGTVNINNGEFVVNDTEFTVSNIDDICINATTNASFYGTTTNIGLSCSGGKSSVVNIGGGTINISGDSYFSGEATFANDVTFNDTVDLISGLSKKLSWSYGTPSSTASDNFNGSANKSFVIPSKIANLGDVRKLTVQHNGTSVGTYDPAGASDTTINIPTPSSITALTDVRSLTIQKNGSVVQIYSPKDSTDKVANIEVPTNISDLGNVRKLTLTRNGVSVGNYNPADTDDTTLNINVPTTIGDLGTSVKSLTCQVNSVTQTTYSPNADATFNVTVPTKASDLTNDLQRLKWALGTPTANSTGYNGSSAESFNIPSRLDHLDESSIKTLTITKTSNGTVTTAGTYNPTETKTINIDVPDLGTLKSLTWSLGTPTSDTTGYNGSTAKNITIPSKISDLTNDAKALTWSWGIPTEDSAGYTGAATKSFKIPNSVTHLTEWSSTNSKLTIPGGVAATTGDFSGAVNIGGVLNVTGSINCQSAIYSSDVNLKENIKDSDFVKETAAHNVEVKEFNFKDDETKRKVYGVIAQDVESAGLDELVHIKEDGYKGVDYTSLMMLKIAYLENENRSLRYDLMRLTERIENLEKNEK